MMKPGYFDPEVELRQEIGRRLAKLAWFEAREHLVRALIGAVEDAGVFRDEAQDEWRMLVDWETENQL